MLISLQHQFIFIANLKTASSSIEMSLRPFCEIAIPQTGYGKHASFAAIERRFPWVFKYVKREEFFVFGVLRDPVDYVLSIYNSHKKPDFIGLPHYTGDKPFPEFYDAWKRRRSWQLEPQSKRFMDSKGSFAADYVLDYEHLNEQWSMFCRVLGVPDVALGHYNRSPEGLGRLDLAPSMIDRLYEDYAVDYECLCACAGFVEAGRSDPLPRLAA
jgi:hypothetical protein